MTYEQQMMFQGRELQAVDYELKTPTLKRTAGDMRRMSKIERDFTDPQDGEILTVQIDYAVAWVNHGADIDAGGLEKDPFARHTVLQAITDSIRIVSYATAAEAEAARDQAYGVTG